MGSKGAVLLTIVPVPVQYLIPIAVIVSPKLNFRVFFLKTEQPRSMEYIT